jgi:GntR family transcriptional regulator/MocR family aminotransferase
MRLLYMERQEEFVEAARRELGGLLEVTPPEAGTHLVGLLPEWLDDREAAKAAAARGVETRPFSAYCLGLRRNGLVLGYGAFSGGRIRTGMRKLAAALGECHAPRAPSEGASSRES